MESPLNAIRLIKVWFAAKKGHNEEEIFNKAHMIDDQNSRSSQS